MGRGSQRFYNESTVPVATSPTKQKNYVISLVASEVISPAKSNVAVYSTKTDHKRS